MQNKYVVDQQSFAQPSSFKVRLDEMEIDEGRLHQHHKNITKWSFCDVTTVFFLCL